MSINFAGPCLTAIYLEQEKGWCWTLSCDFLEFSVLLFNYPFLFTLKCTIVLNVPCKLLFKKTFWSPELFFSDAWTLQNFYSGKIHSSSYDLKTSQCSSSSSCEVVCTELATVANEVNSLLLFFLQRPFIAPMVVMSNRRH